MRPRGFTFVTLLVLVAALAAIFWAVTYGPAYVENFEVGRIVHEAANLCYREHDDEKVKDFIMNRLNQQFGIEVMDHGRLQTVLKFDMDREDIRIDRTEQPPLEVNIWVTYRRTITIPLAGDQRQVVFTDHAGQDLSPVKW
jgi:hypothetical protein